MIRLWSREVDMRRKTGFTIEQLMKIQEVIIQVVG